MGPTSRPEPISPLFLGGIFDRIYLTISQEARTSSLSRSQNCPVKRLAIIPLVSIRAPFDCYNFIGHGHFDERNGPRRLNHLDPDPSPIDEDRHYQRSHQSSSGHPTTTDKVALQRIVQPYRQRPSQTYHETVGQAVDRHRRKLTVIERGAPESIIR